MATFLQLLPVEKDKTKLSLAARVRDVNVEQAMGIMDPADGAMESRDSDDGKPG